MEALFGLKFIPGEVIRCFTFWPGRPVVKETAEMFIRVDTGAPAAIVLKANAGGLTQICAGNCVSPEVFGCGFGCPASGASSGHLVQSVCKPPADSWSGETPLQQSCPDGIWEFL